MEDTLDEDIVRILDEAYRWIEEEKIKGNVLVHCIAGVSRSSTVCLYYLMRRWRWTLEESLKQLRSVRPCVRPNDGFLKGLKGE